MGKVKKTTNSPKKRAGRQTHKKANEQPSTSKATKQIKSRLTTKKQAIADADGDSGISSPEKAKRTPTSDSSVSIARISKKSKSAIAKKSKPVILNKKVNDVNWLKGLIHTSKERSYRSTSGIEARYTASLSLRKDDGIEYVTFPAYQGLCGGYVKIGPNREKIPKITAFTMNFLILIGHIELISGNQCTEYNSGTVITIPKGVRYGLKNKRKEVCFLRFQTLSEK